MPGPGCCGVIVVEVECDCRLGKVWLAAPEAAVLTANLKMLPAPSTLYFELLS